MTNTLIAGSAYDARHQTQMQELARIHTYATRIRQIARKAAANHVSLPCAGDDEPSVTSVHVQHGDRPQPAHSSIKIAS